MTHSSVEALGSLFGLALIASAASAQAQPETPPRRAHHALAFDAARQRVLLHGGSTPADGGESSEFFNDLWEFDGVRWTPRPASGAKLSGMRVAFDARRQRMVSFGGYDGASANGELRVLEDSGWSTLGAHPSLRAAEAGFVYDAKRDRLVAFGGSAGDGVAHGETWEHAGTAWTKLSTAGPPARSGHIMVYDEQRACTVVFGGRFAAPGERPGPQADTWEFDGRTWSRRDVSAPPARMSAGAAYDSRRGLVIVFGGRGAGVFLGDTWSWDGAEWKRLSDTGPEPRAMAGLAYDEHRDRLVLFGGRKEGYPDGDLSDTWEWDGASWRRIGP
jgi:Galactose oxidase, central domain